MNFLKKNAILIIVIIGVLLRILWLGDLPGGFFRDEAALGYNAYSIWQTGRDEFGVRFPLIFRSFEVFFLPLYVYLSAPLVGILGLSQFSARLLSALSGAAAIYLIFLIAKTIFGKKEALLAAGLLAISPWHIFYSRGAFEGNLALTLFAAGFLYFIKFLKKQNWFHVLLSFMFFALSMYSYQAERVVVPLFAISTVFAVYKILWKNRSKIFFPAIFSLLVLTPILSFSFKTAGIHRAAGVSVFNKNPQGWVEKQAEDKGFINNFVFLRTRQVLALYTSYFSPRNLFFEGDYDKQRSSENYSVFYIWTLPLLLIGFWHLTKKSSIFTKLLLFWIIAAPVPAALTGDPFHTYRSLLLYFPLTVVVAKGLSVVFKNSGKYKFMTTLLLIIFSFISLIGFLFNYSIITQGTRARSWDRGYREIISYTEARDFERVVIDDPWTEAYIHYLFFAKVKPEIYHKAVYTLEKPQGYYYGDSSEIRPTKVGKYEFREVNWPKERGDSGSVFVFWREELPESEFISDPKVELLREIYYPDGKVAYRIVKIR